MRRSPIPGWLAFVAAVSLIFPLRARAEDDAPDPAAAYAAEVAALPAPAAEHALRFAGVVRVNGRRMGHAVFEMHPTAGATPQWEAVDHVLLKPDGVPMTETATARMSRALVLASGTVVSTRPGDGSIAWARTDEGFRATRQNAGSDPTVRDFVHAGTALNTLAATIYVLRQALPAPATFATTIFEVEDGLKDEPAMDPVVLKVEGRQTISGREVLAASGKKSDRELAVIFHPESHEVLGVRLTKKGLTLEILVGDEWTMPAPDPLAAGLRAALAFGSGDVDLLDDVIHWPSVVAHVLRAKPPKEGQPLPTVPQVRAALLKSWAEALPKNPGEMMKQVLTGLKEEVKQEKQADGTVLLTFPEAFQNLKLVVGQADGVWSLVKLPGV